MPNVATFAKITAKSGQRAELAKTLEAGFPATESEPGTLLYILHEDAQDPDVLWMYELFVDEAAHQAHQGTESFASLMASATPYFSDIAPEINYATPVFGKGLPA